MKGLDTNVLIRYLVQDNLKQSAQATCFIEEQCTDESPCFIGHITLCEMAWVLDSCYGEGRKKIAAVIEKLLQVNQLEVLDPAVVWQAVNDYMKSNADFSDHLLARVNESQGCEATVTFDKKAGKQPGFEAL